MASKFGKMCQCCDNFNIRVECIVEAIAIIILCVVPICFIVSYGNYGSLIIASIVFLLIVIIAAFCLLFGAILEKRVLVLIFIMVMFPIIVMFIILSGAVLDERWKSLEDKGRALTIIMIIGITAGQMYVVYMAILYFKKLKKGEIQSRYPRFL